MSMWGPDEYRDVARSATSAETRRALADEADRIERREQERGGMHIVIKIEGAH